MKGFEFRSFELSMWELFKMIGFLVSISKSLIYSCAFTLRFFLLLSNQSINKDLDDFEHWTNVASYVYANKRQCMGSDIFMTLHRWREEDGWVWRSSNLVSRLTINLKCSLWAIDISPETKWLSVFICFVTVLRYGDTQTGIVNGSFVLDVANTSFTWLIF